MMSFCLKMDASCEVNKPVILKYNVRIEFPLSRKGQHERHVRFTNVPPDFFIMKDIVLNLS